MTAKGCEGVVTYLPDFMHTPNVYSDRMRVMSNSCPGGKGNLYDHSDEMDGQDRCDALSACQ